MEIRNKHWYAFYLDSSQIRKQHTTLSSKESQKQFGESIGVAENWARIVFEDFTTI